MRSACLSDESHELNIIVLIIIDDQLIFSQSLIKFGFLVCRLVSSSVLK